MVGANPAGLLPILEDQGNFPEFALAMYLCNLKMDRKSLPLSLPEKIKNEVSSVVDTITFGNAPSSKAPDFSTQQAGVLPNLIQPLHYVPPTKQDDFDIDFTQRPPKPQ